MHTPPSPCLKTRANLQLIDSLAVAYSRWPFCSNVPCKLSLSSLPAAPELKDSPRRRWRRRRPCAQIVLDRQIPWVQQDDGQSGVRSALVDTKFQDVRSISLEFLDGRLVSLWIGYDSNFKWLGVPEFVAGISQSLSLPNAWTEWKVRGRQMRCTDFELTVTPVAQSPTFRILDTVAEETLVARRSAAAEEAEAWS